MYHHLYTVKPPYYKMIRRTKKQFEIVDERCRFNQETAEYFLVKDTFEFFTILNEG